VGASTGLTILCTTEVRGCVIRFRSLQFLFCPDKQRLPVTKTRFQPHILHLQPIAAAARSKEWVCGRSLAGIADYRHPLRAWMSGRIYIFIGNLVVRQSSGKEHGNLDSHCSQFFGFHYALTSFLHKFRVNFRPFVFGLKIQFIPGNRYSTYT
jgi:hypothetical protein